MNRQAATPKGFQRRVQDLQLLRVPDPRQAAKVKIPLPTVLVALVTSMVTRARSLRAAEQRTAGIALKHGCFMGLKGRIADNSFGKVLPRLEFGPLLGCLHRLVKAEHRRGNLVPSRLALGTVAIDGKNAGTVLLSGSGSTGNREPTSRRKRAPAVTDDADLAHLRKRLEDRLAAIRSGQAAQTSQTAPVELDQARVGRLSRMDALQQQAMSKATARLIEAERQRIHAALRRIASGEYGYCLHCGEAIPLKRLQVDPSVFACVACARGAGR